jgi:hypothetical protein
MESKSAILLSAGLLAGTKRKRELSPAPISIPADEVAPSDTRSITHKLQAHLDEALFEPRGVGQSTGMTFEYEYGTDSTSIGFVRSIEIPHASDIRVKTLTRRAKAGGRALIRLGLKPGVDATGIDMSALIQALVVNIERRVRPLEKLVHFIEVGAPASNAAHDDCINIVVQIPADAEAGEEVVLQSASIAGSCVELGETCVKTVVGFNHAPEFVEGRLYFAAAADNIIALTEALDDGCSTHQMNEVSSADSDSECQDIAAAALPSGRSML